MPATISAALKAHRTKQLKARIAAGPEWEDRDFVFTTWHGTPLAARNVVRSFHGTLAKAKLPRILFHDLRHSCASLFVMPKALEESAAKAMDVALGR